jgi:methionine-rich copper-binding protein CopC
MRRIRLQLTLVIAVVVAAAVAAVAIAHTDVRSRKPARGGTASKSIGRVSVTFEQQIRRGSLRVVGPGGRVVSVGNGGRDPRNVARVAVSLRGSKRAGRYRARYSIIAADGHRQRGSWRFRLR